MVLKVDASMVKNGLSKYDGASQLGGVYEKDYQPGDMIPADAMKNKLMYWYNGQFYSVGTDAGFTSNDFNADLAAGRFVSGKSLSIDESLFLHGYSVQYGVRVGSSLIDACNAVEINGHIYPLSSAARGTITEMQIIAKPYFLKIGALKAYLCDIRRHTLDYTNVSAFWTYGDGINYDTSQIQAAVDSTEKGLIYFPEPKVEYKVSSIQLHGNITLRGASMQKTIIRGDGAGSVFKTGIYPNGDLLQNRNITYLHMSIFNTGFSCIEQYYAVNFVINNVTCGTSGANSLDVRFSFRAWVTESHFTTSGNYCAILALDNCNNLVLENNRCSAGSTGKAAISVGQSQQVKINSNVIESSGLLAIAVGLDNESGQGNCNGVEVNSNYIEACNSGISLGRTFTVLGVSCKNNFMNLKDDSAMFGIELGKVSGLQSGANTIYCKNRADAYQFLYSSSGSVKYGTKWDVQDDIIVEPVNLYAFTGAWVESFREQTFGTSTIRLYENGSTDAGLDVGKKSISITVPAGETFGYTKLDKPVEGGRLEKILIQNADGLNTGANLTIGFDSNLTESVNIDLSSLTYDYRFATIDTNGRIRKDRGFITRVVNNGSSAMSITIEYRG